MTTAIRTAADNLTGSVSFRDIDNITLKTTGPELLGTPRAPTAPTGTNTTQVANCAFVAATLAAAQAGAVSPSTVPPLPDASLAAVGTSLAYARGDHVHPQFTKAATTTPSQPTANGSVGSSSDFARADHAHPAGAQLLGPNGYVTLPGGVLIQWGTNVFTPGGSNIAFQTPFTTGCWSIALGMNDASNPPTSAVSFSTQTLSGFKGHCSNSFNVSWIAIGK